jgi:hypothetical protein
LLNKRDWVLKGIQVVTRISRVRRYAFVVRISRVGSKEGDQSHLNEDHVCRYVVVAFVVTFVAMEMVLMKEAGDWRGRKDRVSSTRLSYVLVAFVVT